MTWGLVREHSKSDSVETGDVKKGPKLDDLTRIWNGIRYSNMGRSVTLDTGTKILDMYLFCDLTCMMSSLFHPLSEKRQVLSCF